MTHTGARSQQPVILTLEAKNEKEGIIMSPKVSPAAMTMTFVDEWCNGGTGKDKYFAENTWLANIRPLKQFYNTMPYGEYKVTIAIEKVED